MCISFPDLVQCLRGCGEANGVTDDGQVKEDLAYELSREVLEGS